MAAKPNWPEIQCKFVEGIVLADGSRSWPTQGEVAALCGVSRETVNRRARAEGWEGQRHSFITRTSQQRREQTAQAIAAAGAQVDVGAARAAARLIRHVEQHLDEAEKLKVPVAATTAHTLARTLGICQQVLALDGGKPTSVVEQRALDANAEVRRWRAVTERLSVAELEAALQGIAPVRRVQAEIEAEASQGNQPIH